MGGAALWQQVEGTMVAALVLAAAATAAAATDNSQNVPLQALLDEEPADVFLAKATLQQYLSRVVRKDWDGARSLTHPKALARRPALAAWSEGDAELKTFHFTGTRQVAPGVVLIQVGEDTYRADRQGMSLDDPAVYVLFKSRGGFLVADRREGESLTAVPDTFVRSHYPGYVDRQAQAQARRETAMRDKHR
ncbi:MAG TPA: hypothetical protein VFE90_03855 [Myxococcales bacterium]|nr:hypothetical protein [Myxococcales bacterium]